MTDFEEVYRQYFKDVYRFVFSICRNASVAEEITQETFFKALNKIDSYHGACELYVWLCQIAKNTYFSFYAREKRLSGEEEPERLTAADSLEEALDRKETAFQIHRCLHGLAEPYKEVFSLRMFGELSFGQIAELFGKSESWARVTYHRARLKIKEELQ